MPSRNVALPEKWITPEMLSWAREQVGLSIGEAAAHANIEPGRLSAWETGEDAPTLAELETLGELYDCPVGYFFLDQPPLEKAAALDFRGLAPEKTASLSFETRRRLREFVRLVEYTGWLIEAMSIRWKVKLPSVRVSSPASDAVKLVSANLGITAAKKRKWGSPAEAFEAWRSLIEGQGVVVITLRLNPKELRGTSLWDVSLPPAILVNHSDIESTTGRTFTLLHEYAHLITRHSGVVCDFRGHSEQSDLERFANRFAAEAIVPREEFSSLLRQKGLDRFRDRWGDDTLDKLRMPFHASRDVVAVLLQELQLAPEGFYRQKRAMWDRKLERSRPFRRSNGTPRMTKIQRRIDELGGNLSQLLATAEKHGALSRLDLAEILDVPVERVPEFVAAVRKDGL